VVPDKKTPFLGILSLDTAFARIIGDVGNPQSYPFAARVAVVPGAGSPDIVRDGRPTPRLVDSFIATAQQLETDGAAALVSTCGFLISVQADIARAVRIPVMLSGLSLGPTVQASIGGRELGVLTASRAALGPAALVAAGLNPGTVHVAGLDHSDAFRATFLVEKSAQNQTLDVDQVRSDVVAAAGKLLEQAPDIGAIILECGNLPPYAADIGAATGLPVVHLLDGAALLWASACARRIL
jgi:hypothetical protein